MDGIPLFGRVLCAATQTMTPFDPPVSANQSRFHPPATTPWRPLQVECELRRVGEESGVVGHIRYGQIRSPFGRATLAWGARGICWLSFDNGNETPMLREIGPGVSEVQLTHDPDGAMKLGQLVFCAESASAEPLHIHLRGTAFQLRVWELLLRVPFGAVLSYAQLAVAMGQAGAARAVGSAVAHNRVGWLVPCHRVIRADGGLGGYRWGRKRKQMMLEREAVEAGV